MSKITNQVAAQAHAESETFYLGQIEAFTDQLIATRQEIRRFLDEGCCEQCKALLTMEDGGVKFIRRGKPVKGLVETDFSDLPTKVNGSTDGH